MIEALIDKEDNFEIIRDQIAAILTTEQASQQALAVTAGEDPNDWKLRIYSERSNPFESFLNDSPVTDTSPIVNVWFDSSNFDPKASNVSERQKTDGTFNIDCYGYGVAQDVAAGGHKPGDKEAALEAQRAVRLVRNILMAAEYTYLGLRGTVWGRWPQSITVFQPQIDARQVQKVIGARIALNVVYNELSPQVTGEAAELVSTQTTRADDGEILINADFQYPL